MHAADARMVAAGESHRPAAAVQGSVAGRIMAFFVGLTSGKVSPVITDGLVADREEIPVAGGLLPIWTPGHTEGHVAYLWPGDRGVLFVGDAARSGRAVKVSPIYEDYQRGLRSLRELGALDFQVACFSHGRAITQDAGAAFAKTWGS